MIDSILSFLSELGLSHLDYKHHKRIRKKEKQDGKKRPIEKYLMQPSLLGITAILIFAPLGLILFFTHQSTTVYPKNTKNEIAKMSNRMENWKEKYGNYPTAFSELIGNSPIRQDWKKDAWNRPYKFETAANGKDFIIISAGADGEFETEDDITSK